MKGIVNLMQIGNRYKLLEKIGQGGMGAVYKAYDRLEKQTVALKRVETEVNDLRFNSKGAKDDETVAIIQEFSILASLRHPHIISVLDYGLTDGQPFFTMELIPQAKNFIQVAQKLSDPEKVELLIQVLEALRYLHRRGVIHRDLKPDNVLVLDGNNVKVLDFGLSVNAEVAKGRAGTLAYMSPETLKSQMSVPQSDLYAVGVMAYQMLTGKLPFNPKDIISILTKPADISKLGDHLAVMVLERLLLKDPNDRYPTANACIRAFQYAMGSPIDAESITIRESFLHASKFVGREAEWKILGDALDVILQGGTSFYLIGGESGVGKSRLLDELRIQALVSGAKVIRGQAVEGGGMPFQLWRNIIRRLLLMVDINDLQASILKDIVPDIENLIGYSVKKAPNLTGTAYQNRLILTIVDLIRQIKQPLVLLLEDLQWTSESLELLTQLLKMKDQMNTLMVVGSYRNDESPDLPNRLSLMTSIQLNRLNDLAIQELSMSMLGKNGANKDVIELLNKESEGNLFYLVETVRALAEESGGLDEIGHRTLPLSIFTDGMRQLTQYRLKKVDSSYQPIQQLAAIFGREVDLRLLNYHYSPQMVQAWLINASEVAVLSVEDNVWRFAHDKLREMLVRIISEDDSALFHQHAAEAIESIYPNDSDYNATLLDHWHEAKNINKEIHYLELVARYLIDSTVSFDLAVSLLQRGLGQLEGDDYRHVKLLNLLVELENSQGHYVDAQNHANEALMMSRAEQDNLAIGKSLNLLGDNLYLQGKHKDALAYFEESMPFLESVDATYEIAYNLRSLGHIASAQGNYEGAIEKIDAALVIQRNLKELRSIGRSLNALSVITLYYQRDYEKANIFAQESLTLFEQVGDPNGIANALNHLGIIANDTGNYERAIEYHQRGLSIKQQLGDQRGIGISLSNLGEVEQTQGNYETAISYFQQCLDIFLQIEDRFSIALSYHNLGWVQMRQGQMEASTTFHKGLEIAEEIDSVLLRLLICVGFSGVYLLMKQPERTNQLIGMVRNHKAMNTDVQILIDELKPEFSSKLSTEALETALKQVLLQR